ncbi:hypothetical protein Q8A64_18790 [Oxalobacteraceae bacterium R-40]|uniref:Superoxide dismutase n=1 Tax=Keguizhuia sedimenti TaxID=3064264 RepID=A0ABU1BTV7_9BURK|nr:hypothetical protein [Oxalobacteraceae bacterium R-40]
MPYELLPLPIDAKTLHGLSPSLIESHHANNYGSAVKRLNLIQEQLGETDFDQAQGFVPNGLA